MLPANANYEMRNSRTVCLRKKRLNTLIHTRKPRDFSILGNVLRLNPIHQEKFFCCWFKATFLRAHIQKPITDDPTEGKHTLRTTQRTATQGLAKEGSFLSSKLLSTEGLPAFPLLFWYSPHYCLSPHFVLCLQTLHSSYSALVYVGITLSAAGPCPGTVVSRRYRKTGK